MDETMTNPQEFRLPQAAPDRERMMAAFANWLDRVLEGEPSPALPAALLAALEDGEPLPPLASSEGGCDLYGLWSAMTALTQEVRLQGRQFKLLSEAFEQTMLQREDGPRAEGEAGLPRRQQIDLLLELHERLERTVATARAAAENMARSRPSWLERIRPSWLGRRFGGAAMLARQARDLAASLAAGNSLILDQLNEALRDFGVRHLVCLNRPFDPRVMNAIAVELTDAVPEGTVVEVFRNGYEWNGEIYRAAQVKVARKHEGADR